MFKPYARHDILASFLVERIRYMCQVAGSVVTTDTLPSPWLRGRTRELLVQNLLEPLMPHTCRLTSGTVVDASRKRRKRAQDDILLIDGECLPPAFEVKDNGVYPIESVLARFEVKSSLRPSEVESIVDAAEQFWKLRPTTFEDVAGGIKPIQIVFAFDKGTKACLPKLLRLAGTMMRQKREKLFICVPGEGLWAYTDPHHEGINWYACVPADSNDAEEQDSEYQEVLSLIALLLQDLPSLREKKRKATLSRYVRCLNEHKLVRWRPK